ncbi:MAG: manganese efflux pump [Bacillota bacterium]|nr:manganese efflux pump [Bacillota bacterium]
MSLLSVFLFGVSSNIDNLVIGISYGVKKIRIPLISNILIAFITFCGTVLLMSVGKRLAVLIPTEFANAIGSSILILIGLYGIIKFIRNLKIIKKNNEPNWPTENPEKYDENNNKQIEMREAITLGILLSINNMGLGIGASISGLNIIPTAIGAFIFSMCSMLLGNALGNSYLSTLFGKYGELVSGLIIIAMGILELIF